MVDIMNFVYLVVGIGATYIFVLIDQRRNKTLFNFTRAIKKRKPIVFLETDKSVYYRTLARTYKNLGITPEKEIIIIPKASVKPCLNLNGVEMVHGDLYKSITTPAEFRIFVDEMKDIGWKEDDLAKFLEEIEVIPPEQLKNYWASQIRNNSDYNYFKVENGQKFPINAEEYDNLSKDENNIVVKEKNNENGEYEEIKLDKFNVFKNLPSVLKDFIYTGINRVSIASMLREMVYQRELEKVGGRNWLTIAVAIMIIIIAVAVGFRMITGSGGIGGLLGGLLPTTPTPTQIAP